MKKSITLILLIISIICLLGCSNKNINISIIPYTVTFNTNGGTKIESIKTTKIEESPVTKRTNYIFDGWYLDNQFINLVIFPLKVENDITLYAKWVKSFDQIRCKNSEIEFLDSDYSSSLSYNITPNQFNYDRLSELGYEYIQMVVEYNVYYKKDYNIPFDIGYAGLPKYELYITNSQLLGFSEENLKTTKESTYNKYTYTLKFSDLINLKYTLTFSTDNVQNVIYFESIIVSYYVIK